LPTLSSYQPLATGLSQGSQYPTPQYSVPQYRYSTQTAALNLQHYAQYFQQNPATGLQGYNFGAPAATTPTTTAYRPTTTREQEEDEEIARMDDADYSAQLQFQSQSKADLKVLLDHFTPDQHARFEAYRRSALNKNSVKKVIQSTTGQQVSPPVAQVVAGIAKMFVGEIVEKAREIQERQGQSGSLAPEHLRAAYRMYQEEYGCIGPAKPLKGKKLFVR